MDTVIDFLKAIDRNPGQTPQVLLDTILHECRKFTCAEAGTVFLVRHTPDGNWLEPVSLQNDAIELEQTRLVVPLDERSISGYVALNGGRLLIDDAYKITADKPYGFNPTFDVATAYRTVSIASIALRHPDGRVNAVVQLLNRLDADGNRIPFDDEQADFIAAAGVVISGAIERAEMMEQLAARNRELNEHAARIEGLQKETAAALMEAERSNRAKSEFIACIGHELKTPLNAIIGFSELLANESFGPLGHPSYKEFAEEAAEGGHKLLALVNDILGIVTAETAQVSLSDDHAAIAECVEYTCRSYFERAAEANLLFVVDIADTPCNGAADLERLQTVLERLIDNAIKFTEAGGKITVSMHPAPKGGFRIRIADDGVGMSPDDLVRALAPFGQADSSLSRNYEGAGLGMTLAGALTRSMNGTMAVDSTPGEGTTVTLAFPPAKTETASGPPVASGRAVRMRVAD